MAEREYFRLTLKRDKERELIDLYINDSTGDEAAPVVMNYRQAKSIAEELLRLTYGGEEQATGSMLWFNPRRPPAALI